MKIIPLSTLTILPDRQRPPDSASMAPERIAELADSIERLGLLQAPVIEEKASGPILRAGERRTKAISFLAAQGIAIRYGTTLIPLGSIPVLPYSELSDLDAFLIELEENDRRENLTWQEKARALSQLAALKSRDPSLTRSQVTRDVLATVQKVAPSMVDTTSGKLHDTHQAIVLGDHLSDPDIAKAKTQREAAKILEKKMRQAEDRVRPIAADPHLLHGDAVITMMSFPDSHFDCILTDPPYGVGITEFSTQASSEHEYDDSYANWLTLMPRFLAEAFRVLKGDAHAYLFCDFSRFDELRKMAVAAGFETYSRPLIWDRHPDGRLTTAEKWPRRVYECILYLRKGTRALLEVRSDILTYPADRDSTNHHGAKKPVDLAIDLLQRSTRPGERVLDAFAGSGFVPRAGKRINREVWAIEGNSAAYGLMLRLLETEDAPQGF